MGLLKTVGKFFKKINPITSGLGAVYGLYSNQRANRAAKLDRQRNSLSGRVAEAKAAGIHPLAALGYNAGGTVPGQQSTGSGMSGGVDQVMRKTKPSIHRANLRAINASAARDEAAAAEHWSNVARSSQRANSQPSMGQSNQLDVPPQMIDLRKPDGSTVKVPNPEKMEDEVSGNLWALEQFWNRYKERSSEATAKERARIKRVLKYGRPAKRKPYYPSEGKGTIRR